MSDRSGDVVGVSAATGSTEWARALPEPYQLQSPVAADGVVYVDSAWDGGGLYALNEADGSTKWFASNYTEGNPALAGGLAYVSDDYEGATSAYSLVDGSSVWSGTSQCFVGSGHVVADGARLIGPWNSTCGSVLDGGTGAVLDTIASSAAPASAGDVAVVLDGSTLQGRSLRSGVLLWQFAGDQGLTSSPVIVNGTVYEGSSSGTLFAVDLQTGSKIWSGSVAATGTIVGAAGMAAGDGLLVVPSGGTLTALESAVARPGLNVHVDAGPDGPTVAHTATLAFSSDDPSVPERCRLDAGAWGACSATVAYTALASGPHMFEVETVDQTDGSTIGLAVRGWSVVTSLPGSGSAGSGGSTDGSPATGTAGDTGTTANTGTTSTPASTVTPIASSGSPGAGSTDTAPALGSQTGSPIADRAQTATVSRVEDTALARSLAAATAALVKRKTHAGLRAGPAIYLYSRGAETISITIVGAAKGRPFTLGTASARFAATGSRNVHLVLSRAGRRALAGRAALSLVVRASVAPVAGARVSATATARF